MGCCDWRHRGYRIRYKENSGSSWSFDTTNTNSITLTGLNVNTVHRWQVKSICDLSGTNTSNWTAFSCSKQVVIVCL